MSSLQTVIRYILAWIWSIGFPGLGCFVSLVTGPSRAWIWVTKRWAAGTLWLLGIKIQLHGAHHLTTPAVYICNHQSLLDVVVIPAILPNQVRFIAKRELLFIPFWGWFLAAGGAVLINRKASRSAIESIRQGLRRLPRGWSMVVFPEGTRSQDGELKDFKRGAFHVAALTGLPVIPIGIDGARDVAPLRRWLVRSGVIRITVGAPIDTTGWSPQTIEKHMHTGREAVQACMTQARSRRQTAGNEDSVQAVAFAGEPEGSL